MTAAVNGKKIFGAGRFFGINNVSNPTPARFSVMQDQTITFKRTAKSLFGENQLAEDVCGAEMEVTGKVTLGVNNARILSDLVFGNAGTTGQTKEADKEAGTVPAATAFTVSVANAAKWSTDLGVRNVTTGQPMTAVASAPAQGQYSVAAGVYTFAAADANVPVQISYLWNDDANGQTVAMSNQPMGKIGNFTAAMIFPWGAEQDVLTLNNCISTDHEIASKGSDYAKPTFGFMAACDTNDTLGNFSFAEAA